MKYSICALLVLVALLVAPRADAQQLTLAIRDGRVSMDASNVPVRQILREWARIGGVTIVNGDKIAGPAVTLQLKDLPERKALDIILRGVSGYVLAARPVGAPMGASTFDRILILATSAAPRPTPTGPPVAQTQFRPAPAPMPMPPVIQQDEQDDPADQQQENAPDPRRIPRRFPFQPNMPPPVPPVGPGAPAAQPPVTSPANPFGSPGGSGRPGMVAPPPASPAPASNIPDDLVPVPQPR